jgi:hypothetical protein
VTPFAVVVTLDPKGQVTLQLLRREQDIGVIVEAQFVLEGGEEAFHHRVVSAAALG